MGTRWAPDTRRGLRLIAVTPEEIGAADRIRTGDVQLGKAQRDYPEISRSILSAWLTHANSPGLYRGLPGLGQNPRQKHGRTFPTEPFYAGR